MSMEPIQNPTDLPGYPAWFERSLMRRLVTADSVEDFAAKYRKHERYGARGEEYCQAVLNTHREEIEKYGMTWIGHYDSSTGELVAWKPE